MESLPPPPSPPNTNMQIDDELPGEEAMSPIYTEFFSGASKTFGEGKTYQDLFNEDKFADARRTNLYYLFASKAEWEMASFLLTSDLSRAAIDRFLKLQIVCIMQSIEE
jgi:hypothetical protein